MNKEEMRKAMEEIALKVGSVKKEGSNVVSFRCNAKYQSTIAGLQVAVAPFFNCEADDIPVSTVVKFALEYAWDALCKDKSTTE